MFKIPRKPADIFQEITEDYKNVFGDDLLSITLYGSAAKGEYLYKKSDINFVITLTEKGIDNLIRCLPLIPKWQKRNVSTPLLLTKEYIESSLDTFPIEFLNMNMNYQVIYGDDVLKDILIEEEDLRLQCEQELRRKLLYLRKEFLNSAANTGQLKILISQSMATFTSIFSTLLKLADFDVPRKRADVFKKIAEVYRLNYAVFDDLLQIREKKKKVAKQQLHTLMEQYILEIRKVTQAVDRF